MLYIKFILLTVAIMYSIAITGRIIYKHEVPFHYFMLQATAIAGLITFF